MKTTKSFIVLIIEVMILSTAVMSTTVVCANNRGIARIGQLTHTNKQVGTYRALLIGIQNYNDPKIPDLETPLKDVREIGAVLKDRYGFKVDMLLEGAATREAMYKALRQLASATKPEDSVLIYYAGHGDLDRQYNDGWWIPVDAAGGNPTTYLDNMQVQKAMKNMAARHVLLISDSCYSGTLFGQARAMPPVIDDRYYLNLYNEKSRWGMTSGNKTPVSDSGTAGHSVFAYQLIKKLQANDKPYLSTQEIYTAIAPIIGNNSEQTPLCRPIHQTGDQGGEFIFIASSGAVVDDSSSDSQNGDPSVSFLSVESTIPDADVYLERQYLGKTNLNRQKVSPGSHTIRITKNGYTPYERKLKFIPGQNKSLFVDLSVVKPSGAKLYVDVKPDNAIVRILNITPAYFRGMDLPRGRYHIEVSRDDAYEKKSFWITLDAGEEKYLDIVLDKKTLTSTVVETISGNGSGSVYGSGSGAMTGSGTGYQAGDTWTDSVTGMEFVWVPGGCFNMGSNEGGSDEKPIHEVCLDGFWMGKYEVTQKEWQSIMGNNPSYFKKGDRFPVEQVSWDDAKAFIKKLNGRTGETFALPSEAQWEYAARSGGKNQKYSGGNDVNRFAWYNKNSGGTTHKVGTKAANDLGIHDMSGNVWEWCEDIYAKGAYKKHTRNNPIYAQSGSNRVLRGGGWRGSPASVRCANRFWNTPGNRDFLLGFRLLRAD